MPDQVSQGVQHFIYPLTEEGGYSFDGLAINPKNYWASALKGSTDEWGLATGYRLMSPGDWVWAYFGGSVRRICGVGVARSAVGWRDDWSRHSVFIRWEPKLTSRLRRQPISYDAYQQRVQAAAVRANPKTLRVLRAWLGREAPGALEHATEVKFAERAVIQRLGQSGFRAAVLEAYEGRCAITGCGEDSVLEAAHILAVSSGGKHSVENSVLMRADLHNLFDLGFITVGPRMKVEVAPEVQDRQYRRLAGKTLAMPRGTIRRSLEHAFAEHRRLYAVQPARP